MLIVALGALLAGCNGQAVRATDAPAASAQTNATIDVQAELAAAATALEQDALPAARERLEALARSAPQEPLAWLNLGLVHLRAGDAEAAIDALAHAVQLAPARPAAHNLLGVANRQAGRIADARAAYDEALRLDPGYALAHYNLAVLYDVYLQDPGQALAHYRLYQALNPEAGAEVTAWITQLEADHAN